MHKLRITRLELSTLARLTTGRLSHYEVLVFVLGQLLLASPSLSYLLLSALSLSFSFSTPSLSPHCPPWCASCEWGSTGLIPSGKGTGKAKCLPSPQSPAGKEGQAPQNRKAGALGGGHIRDSSQKPEPESREAAVHNLHEKNRVHFSFS